MPPLDKLAGIDRFDRRHGPIPADSIPLGRRDWLLPRPVAEAATDVGNEDDTQELPALGADWEIPDELD